MGEEWTTKKIDKYVLINRVLGQGNFGKVYRGFQENDESKQVAVKTLKIATITEAPRQIGLVKREIEILQKIKHPNIVRLYDVARTNNYLYMFLEHCADGDLKEYMDKKDDKRLSELETVIFIKHIVEGFKQLYALRIIHRDIKPANILLHQGVAKISDFGFARVMDKEMNDPAYLSRLGSPLYMAPQIIEGQPFSAKCDVWSIGIMFYELLYGRTPWNADTAFQLLENIKKQPLKFPAKPVRSQKAKELIASMLKISEKDRISWEGVFEDPLIKINEKQIKDNMEMILKEKDEISKSISLNKLYIEQNLVVGYLASNPVNSIFSSTPTMLARQEQSQTSIGSHDNEIDGNSIISNYKSEKKRREAVLRYNNYFLFERNISFFFNFVIQKIIKLQQDKTISLNNDNYYRLIYLISKNQMIHLERVNVQINKKDQDKFDKETWGKFMASQEYANLVKLITTDKQHSFEFYREISKKTLEVQQGELTKNPSQAVKTMINNVLAVVNENFEAIEPFHRIYRDIIAENIKIFKQNYANVTQCSLCLYHLLICANPYEEFKEISYDFNQFYEETENLTLQEVQEKIGNKKQIV